MLAGEVTPTAAEGGADAIFSGWHEWEKKMDAIAAERNIKTFTSLEQIGLSDAEMIADDFDASLTQIVTSAPSTPVVIMLATGVNLRASVVKKLNDSGLPFGLATTAIQLKIERSNGKGASVRVSLFTNLTTFHGKMTNCVANQNGDKLEVSPFFFMADTQLAPEIILLNGWEANAEGIRIAKNGNYVSVNFVIRNGLTAEDTIIGVIPEGFRPQNVGVSVPLNITEQGTSGYLYIRMNGEMVIHGLSNAIGNIFCASGFSI